MVTKFHELRESAVEYSQRAYSPYSKARVGCSLITDSGKIFSGCNIENGSYGGTICAERVAILKAISEGEKLIKKLYVYTADGWPPCGLCLQTLAEFAHNDCEVIIGDAKGTEKKLLFKSLLPHAFTPSHLSSYQKFDGTKF